MTTGGQNHDCSCNKCCPGPMGSMGLMGPQGPQGVDGPQGIPGPQGIAGRDGLHGRDGQMGPMGPQGQQGPTGQDGQPGLPGQQGIQGPTGPMGPQGQQGVQGPKGDCVECPCHCEEPEYAEVYSTKSQILSPSPGPNLPGQFITFENTVVATSNIDISLAATMGKIKINKAGWYRVNKSVSGSLTPIGIPLNVWTMALFVNGVVVPQSCFANMTISPTQEANQTTAISLIHFNVGDILMLCNTSIATLDLNSIVAGSNVVPVSAELNISLLKAD